MRLRRLHTTALLAAALLMLAGCANMRIHSETRDTQATAAKAAFDALELQKGIDTERANLGKLLEAELAMQERLARSVRDFRLRAMLDSQQTTRKALLEPLANRINGLAGDAGKLAAAQGIVVSRFEDDENVARYKRSLAGFGLQLPSCEEMLQLAPAKLPPDIERWLSASKDVVARILVRDTLDKDYRTLCSRAHNQGSPYAQLGGEVGAAWARYNDDLADLNARKGDVKELQGAYAEAQDALDKATKKTKSNPELLPDVQAAAKKVDDVLEKLKKAKGVDNLDRVHNPYLAKFLSEKRIESIESFLSAVTQYEPGQPLPASASKAAMISTLLPQLVDQSKEALAQANKPLVTPYVLARNYNQLNLEAANRDIAASEAIVRHSREIVEVLFMQAQQLLLAQNELNATLVEPPPKGGSVVVATKYADASFIHALKTGSAPEKQALYSATARYLDALNRLDAKRYKLEYMRIADFHERSLAYAEVNTRQWESLIGTSVGQLQEFGAGGWKPEQAVGLVNTLMLFWIGSGVN